MPFKMSSRQVSWFWLGLAALFLLSLALRFWGLSRFNTLVFDEVYYARYGNDYLTQTPYFDVHPPLGKYLIGLGIWLSRWIPFGQGVQTTLDGFTLPTFSYRWMNALVGSMVPLVAAGLAYQLSHRRSFALLAGVFTAVDGLLLVESRYALINIYLIFFGLLGQFLLLLALDRPIGRRVWLLLLAGICFGASASVKWNGLGFLLGVYLVWCCVNARSFWNVWRSRPAQATATSRSSSRTATTQARSQLPSSSSYRTPVHNLAKLSFLSGCFYLAVVPAVTYGLLWLPHLHLNPSMGFLQLHQQILGYHRNLGSGAAEHPYCSAWYSWPWMGRPVGYYYQSTDAAAPDAATSAISEPTIYDVHGMGNPILWWLSTLAIACLVAVSLYWITRQFRSNVSKRGDRLSRSQVTSVWIANYLVLNYAANFLPWIGVGRCSFIYLYMAASIFSFLGLALLVDRSLQTADLQWRPLGIAVIVVVVAAFLFWLPIYLGLPLSPDGFQMRMWFRSWI